MIWEKGLFSWQRAVRVLRGPLNLFSVFEPSAAAPHGWAPASPLPSRAGRGRLLGAAVSPVVGRGPRAVLPDSGNTVTPQSLVFQQENVLFSWRHAHVTNTETVLTRSLTHRRPLVRRLRKQAPPWTGSPQTDGLQALKRHL